LVLLGYLKVWLMTWTCSKRMTSVYPSRFELEATFVVKRQRELA
jgi:hypothetical protein